MDFLKENQNTLTNIQRIIEEKQKLRGTLDDTIQILNEKVVSLTDKYETMMAELANARIELPKLKEQEEALKETIRIITSEISDATKELERLDNQLANRSDLSVEIKTLQIQRDTLRNDIETEKSIKTDLETQTKSLQGLRNTLQTEYEYLERQIKDLQPELDKNTNLLSDIKKEKEHAQNLFDNAEKLLKEVEAKKKEFIENPLSIGYYAGLIKQKHNIDILKMLQ